MSIPSVINISMISLKESYRNASRFIMTYNSQRKQNLYFFFINSISRSHSWPSITCSANPFFTWMSFSIGSWTPISDRIWFFYIGVTCLLSAANSITTTMSLYKSAHELRFLIWVILLAWKPPGRPGNSVIIPPHPPLVPRLMVESLAGIVSPKTHINPTRWRLYPTGKGLPHPLSN